MTATRRLASFLIASALILLGVSYGKLYLFHVALALLALHLLASGSLWRSRRLTVDWSFVPFCVWTLLGFVWTDHPAALGTYCVFLFFAFSILFVFRNFCRSESELNGVFRTIAWVVGVEYAISLLECFGILRLPTSMFSPWAAYLGRQPYDPLETGQTLYFLTPPTAFMGNPNDLAFTLNCAFPFLLFADRRWLRWAGTLAHAIILLFIQSRVAYVVFLLELCLGSLLLGKKGLLLLAALSVAVAVAASGFLEQFATHFDLGKTTSLFESVHRYIFGGGYDDDSVGVRRQLITRGLEKLQDSYYLGIGVGAFAQEVSVDIYGGARTISDLHNFWVQLLVEGGAIGFAAYAWFHGRLILGLATLLPAPLTPRMRYLVYSSFVALAGGVLGVISMSGAYYVLPFWVILGFASATARVAKSSRAPIRAVRSTLASLPQSSSLP